VKTFIWIIGLLVVATFAWFAFVNQQADDSRVSTSRLDLTEASRLNPIDALRHE
jgi:hypothetical protein